MTTTSRLFLVSPPRCLLLLFASASIALLLYSRPSSASRVDAAFDVSPNKCYPPKGMGPLKLEVVHRYGPYSPFEGGSRQPPPHVQILRDDQARVNWIHLRISAATAGGSAAIVKLPAFAGGNLSTGNYIVTVGVGTPRRDFIVGFDTGSDLTWIQCTPCSNCYEQEKPLFDPKESTTYGAYNCSSAECENLQVPHSCSADASVCRYDVRYGDGSDTMGNFSHDTLTLGSDVVPRFTFGCGDRTIKGTFGHTDGLIGLGRGRISLPTQLSQKYGSVFSYCLPSNLEAKGYLAIGREATPTSANIQYTSMINSASDTFYTVNLTAIEVQGRPLAIQGRPLATPAVMDSGTVITQLPSAAYVALREAFMNGMTNFTRSRNSTALDTCYNLTGMEKTLVPRVTLVFDGGARLELDFRGILYVLNESECCLAFLAMHNDSTPTIIGNVQQRTYGVIYDVENSRIGFAPNSCQ